MKHEDFNKMKASKYYKHEGAEHEDEAWPAEYSVRTIEKNLKAAGYDKDVKAIVYPHGSHLNVIVDFVNYFGHL